MDEIASWSAPLPIAAEASEAEPQMRTGRQAATFAKILVSCPIGQIGPVVSVLQAMGVKLLGLEA